MYISQGMHLLMHLFCTQPLLPIAASYLRNIYPILLVGNNNGDKFVLYLLCRHFNMAVHVNDCLACVWKADEMTGIRTRIYYV